MLEGIHPSDDPFERYKSISPIAMVSTVGIGLSLYQPDRLHFVVAPGRACAIFKGGYIAQTAAELVQDFIRFGLTPQNKKIFVIPDGRPIDLEFGVVLDSDGNLTFAYPDDGALVETKQGNGVPPLKIMQTTTDELFAQGQPNLYYRPVKQPNLPIGFYSCVYGTNLPEVALAHINFPFNALRYQN